MSASSVAWLILLSVFGYSPAKKSKYLNIRAQIMQIIFALGLVLGSIPDVATITTPAALSYHIYIVLCHLLNASPWGCVMFYYNWHFYNFTILREVDMTFTVLIGQSEPKSSTPSFWTLVYMYTEIKMEYWWEWTLDNGM